MMDWRDQVLRQFNTSNSLYIVLDEDRLLLDEKILARLQADRVRVVNLQDSILFRYEFESEYRYKIEQGELCLLVRAEEKDYHIFPYEMIHVGRKVRLNMSSIFPKFSAPIIRQLDVEVRDALYAAHERYQGSSSDRETLDFLARHVYKLPYDVVHTREDVWKLLLTMHYEAGNVPQVVKEYIIRTLESRSGEEELPIHELVMSKSFFYRHLEEQWHMFVHQLHQLTLTQREMVVEQAAYYIAHPFTSPYMKGILDNLFVEGLLQPVAGINAASLPKWTHVGLEIADENDQQDKVEGLYKRLAEAVLGDYRYRDWLKVAELYGQLKHLSVKTGTYTEQVQQVANKLNTHFQEWMLSHYGALISLPHLPFPKMVHHIPRYLATKEEEKIALLVMDGMGITQWVQIREQLLKQGLLFEESSVFAWVPTLTSVSRQAIFAGVEPFHFASSISTTNKEPKLWETFWEDQGISRRNVAYQKRLGTERYERDDILPFQQPHVRVYGAVVDIIDQALHGAVQGTRSVAGEIDIWLDTNYLYNLIRDLKSEGFTVYLTADHGNTDSVGSGRISEGVLVEKKGERVRTYSAKELRDHTAAAHPQTIAWSDIGLPEHFHVLLAKDNTAFVHRGERIVSHGGISIDEVIVPFVKVMS